MSTQCVSWGADFCSSRGPGNPPPVGTPVPTATPRAGSNDTDDRTTPSHPPYDPYADTGKMFICTSAYGEVLSFVSATPNYISYSLGSDSAGIYLKRKATRPLQQWGRSYTFVGDDDASSRIVTVTFNIGNDNRMSLILSNFNFTPRDFDPSPILEDGKVNCGPGSTYSFKNLDIKLGGSSRL